MFNKVLILSASSGAGHVRAGQALEKALLELSMAKEVKHIDTLDYTNKIFRTFYSRAYIDMVNHMPEVLGWLYDKADRPWQAEKRRLAFDKLNTRPFIKMLQKYQPDISVCTHFLPCEIISWLKAKEHLNSPQAIVVTDFDVHAMWLCHYFEHYFVALDETKIHLSKLGIPESRITRTGIPIDPAFTRLPSKQEARKMFGLDPNKTTILLSTGGFGVGPINNLLLSLLELKHPAQIIVICGRNDKLKARLTQTARTLPPDHHLSLMIVGYTSEIHFYMAASDILVGKPGGLTTSEALAAGLVMVVVNPIPGQEERNSDHLLEEGAAIRCNNLPVLAFKIDQLLDDSVRFRQMQEKVQLLARPNAAYDVVNKLLTLDVVPAPKREPRFAKLRRFTRKLQPG
ncbi:MAG TPA: glycosyltransferase [Candidatus Obscuribacterales bacterium]